MKTLLLLILSSCVFAASLDIEMIGDSLQYALPISASIVSIQRQDYEGLRMLGTSVLVSAGITHTLKNTIDAERPNGRGNNSFPSGHTTLAFASASYIHHRYGLDEAILPYILASFVGYSRIQADKHYVHDVLAGAAIGILTDYFITDRWSGPRIIPIVETNYIGLAGEIRF